MRPARILWLALVLIGATFTLSGIALDIGALIVPKWVIVKTLISSGMSIRNRGLFLSCEGVNCRSDAERETFFSILSLRLTDWALHVVALGIEGFTFLTCMIYLIRIRYFTSSPCAQKAQMCLCISGFMLWIAALFATIANLIFTFTLTMEKISPGTGLNGLFADIPAAQVASTSEAPGESIICTWLSVCTIFLASWFWLWAAYVQTPAHIVYNQPTLSQTPLFSSSKLETQA